MPYCPLCNKPLMMVQSCFPENYCQCAGLEVTVECITSWGATVQTHGRIVFGPPPEPEKTAIPAGILASLEGVDLNV